jgi:hypothetical protein
MPFVRFEEAQRLSSLLGIANRETGDGNPVSHSNRRYGNRFFADDSQAPLKISIDEIWILKYVCPGCQ